MNKYIIRVCVPDERYICVSMEHINYTPIAYEVLKKERML